MTMRQRLLRAACAFAISTQINFAQTGPGPDAPTPASAESGDRRGTIQEIRRLGKTDSQAIPVLTQHLSDPDADVRIEAVRAIVRIGGGRSLDPLVRATHDNDPDVDVIATNGIVNFYMPGYVDKGAFTRPFTRGMRQVRSLLSVPNRQEVAPGLFIRDDVQQALAEEIAHAPSADARANAARAAGILRAPAAVPALEEALRSRDTQLILESLYALQKIGDPAAGPSAGYLVRDLDNRVQVAALETVGVLRSLTSAPDIRAALDGARNKKASRAALQALSLLGMPGDRPVFQRYASDSDANMRAAALEGLGRIREPQDTPLLQAAFDEQGADWRVHLAAAFALVDEGNVSAAEFAPLPYLVHNFDQPGRGETAQAYLTELCRREDVRKGVYAMLSDTTVPERVALCSILGSSHAPDAIDALTNLANDSNSDVALAANKGLQLARSAKK